MEMRLNNADTAFDGHTDDDEENSPVPAGYLEDNRYNPAEAFEKTDHTEQSNSALYQVLNQLDARSQEILSARWLNEKKATLQELAEKYQISAERVRQLEKKAMDKLKCAMEKAMAA
jgi:RNA polymerase sigma-32 factor